MDLLHQSCAGLIKIVCMLCLHSVYLYRVFLRQLSIRSVTKTYHATLAFCIGPSLQCGLIIVYMPDWCGTENCYTNI